MKLKAIFYILCLFLISATTGVAQDSAMPVTNEQFVLDAVEKCAINLLDSLGVQDTVVYLDSKTGLPGLVVDGFKAALLKRGVRFSEISNDAGTDITKFDISLSAFEFTYSSGKSRGFMRKPYIKRQVIGQVQVSITGGGADYLQFRDFASGDEVDPGDANYVGSVRYNQLSPEPPGRKVMKYIEPLAVTATVGGLIYLFFINR